MTSLLRGSVVAGAAALAVALATVLGLASPWPVLLVAAIAFARPLRPGVVGAVLVGAMSWWIAMAMRAAVLPDATSSEVLATVVAVLIVTVTAAATRERLPLLAGLGGIALLAGIYEPVFADAPTRFLTDSVLALGTVVVAVGLGSLAAVAADLLVGLGDRRGVTAGSGTRAVS